MKVLQFFGGIVFLFFILSCTDTQNNLEEQFPEGSVKLKYNVQQSVCGDLLLEVLSVTDNRCPIGAVCSGAGLVEISLRVLAIGNNGVQTMYFSEMPNATQNVDTIFGYRIELLEVSPIPYIDNPVDSNTDYIITVFAEQL